MDIDDIFSEYEGRKSTLAEREEEKKAIQNKERDAGLAAIKETVEPVFLKIRDQINQKGHKAEIKTGYECVVHPRIELQFTVVTNPSNLAPYSPASKMEVRHLEQDKLKVTREINTTSGAASAHIQGSGTITPKHSTATPEWVEKITLEFVRAVLNAN